MELNISQKIQEKVKLLPQHPGVYIMKDINGKVIYVGKAKRLKNRVKSYFDGTQKTVKTYALVSNIDDFEYILTNTELDAFSLESNLIKKHKPKYNILLKDDKSFPYIRINLKERFPRVTVVRRPKKDGSLLFGPYVTGLRISEIMDLIKWAFPIRWCSTNFDNGKSLKRPCLHGEIGNCVAPCAYKEREEEYNQTIQGVINFLNGETSEIKARLKTRMMFYADRMQFEEALNIKNLIEVVDNLDEELITSLTKETNLDVFAICMTEEYSVINVMKIRAGKNVGQFNFPFEEAVGSEQELLLDFISSHYEENEIPKEIILPEFMKDDEELLTSYLNEKALKKIVLSFPVKGTKRHLLDNAFENAQEFATNSRDRFVRHRKLTSDALEELSKIVKVENIYRIEGYDISNISGTNNVASMVVFEGGEPNKKEYRKFKIKTVDGPNDFACMQETLERRFKDYLEGKENFETKPDLILIDGGLGQLGSVKQILDELNINIPVISLAKQDEEIFVTGSNVPIRLEKSNYALRLLQRVRDESHRFAVMYHRNLRGQSVSSFLNDIPGVGKKTAENIWKHFKTKDKIFNAKPEEFAEIEGVSEKKSIEIYRYIHSDK